MSTKKSKELMTPNEFVKGYKIDSTLNPVRRGLKFMLEWAEIAPGRCMDRRLFARMAYNLGSTPGETNFMYKRGVSLWTRVKDLAMKEMGVGWASDPTEGIRLTFSASDLHNTTDLHNQKKAISVIRRLEQSTNAVDADDLTPEERREHEQRMAGTRTLLKGLGQMPALPPAPDDKKK
jgi:hypothetical protein